VTQHAPEKNPYSIAKMTEPAVDEIPNKAKINAEQTIPKKIKHLSSPNFGTSAVEMMRPGIDPPLRIAS
jgi:hypothetical protein